MADRDHPFYSGAFLPFKNPANVAGRFNSAAPCGPGGLVAGTGAGV